MTADLMSIRILAVLFLATLVRSTLGFGEALIAVPLLALFIPIQVAAPVVVLISITVAAIALIQDWRHVHLRSASWLVVSTLIGTPLGLLLLTRAEGAVVKACLGLFLAGFAAYSLLRGTRAVLEDDRFAWPFGLSAGVLGGAYGMNGPPLVIYGTLRGWSPQRFRATLQGYFLPASATSMLGYWLAGLWRPQVTRYYLMSLPGVLVATFLGRRLNGRIEARSFLRWVNLGLLVIAVMLLAQSLHGAP
ncbi:MAG: sulfite exporter TauE/SafE family protein [Proteobacteria bacterium]|nr:sulfite exporter TauE/SafE family protein [Pseudomonadota bacterium]